MPSSLEDLLGSHSKDEPSTSRDISTRIGALKARLTRATAASGGTTAPDVRLSSPHLTEPSYRRASVGGGELGRLASEIPDPAFLTCTIQRSCTVPDTTSKQHHRAH